MFLEYLFQPVQNARYAVLAIQRIEPRLPFWFLAAITVLFITAWLAVGLIYAGTKRGSLPCGKN